MGRGSSDYAPAPEVVGNRKLMRSIGIILLLGGPIWVESAWILASWWRPIIGFGPLPGFKTPCLTFLGSLTGFGSTKAGDAWGDLRSNIFSTPTAGITIFLTIAIGCILLMKRNQAR